MSETILVLNPNSTQSVTDEMSAAVEPFRLAGAPLIVCETLREGPPGVETQAQVDASTQLMIDWLATRPAYLDCAAVVIGCFSDPGLFALRERLRQPVFGIGECGFNAASALAERFGSIAIVSGSLGRHRRKIRALGFEHRYVGGLAAGLGVVELADRARTWGRLQALGTQLRDESGAQAIVLGCAGFSPYRSALEQHLGVPVIDPTQAAVAAALGQVLARRAMASVPGQPAAAAEPRRAA